MVFNNSQALLDADFLTSLDKVKNKKTYVKIISLNWEEDPIAEITGNIVSGSINVDGSSKVRRTCNISLITNDIKIDRINWTLRTKFYVFIGLENTISSKYESIIWFPQGMYVITSFNSSLNAQGYTISIQGKDKMCLINGDIGGALTAATEFSKIWETQEDGTVLKKDIPIYTIIQKAIHQYAQEPYHNIIINDLDTCGVELLDYVGDKYYLYIYENYIGDYAIDENNISKAYAADSEGRLTLIKGYPTFSGALEGQIDFGPVQSKPITLIFDQLCLKERKTADLPPVNYDGTWYFLKKKIKKTDSNTVAGYRATDVIWNEKELLVSVGGTIVQMLDKLVKMLGEFEYYYDVYGRFIFQRKKIYFNTSWSNAIINQDETYYDSSQNRYRYVYDFSNNYLIASIQNKPQINAIKNDYAIWGAIKNTNGANLPIHLRYAIDIKPKSYYSLLEQKPYFSTDVGGPYDWRELIYQMARDNLAAESRIKGLQHSIASINEYEQDPDKTEEKAQYVRYHYDYSKLLPENYNSYYRYDDYADKFVLLKDIDEFYKCKMNHEFLYGPQKQYQKLELDNTFLKKFKDKFGYDYLSSLIVQNQAEENTLKQRFVEYKTIFDNFYTSLQNAKEDSGSITILPRQTYCFLIKDFIPEDDINLKNNVSLLALYYGLAELIRGQLFKNLQLIILDKQEGTSVNNSYINTEHYDMQIPASSYYFGIINTSDENKTLKELIELITDENGEFTIFCKALDTNINNYSIDFNQIQSFDNIERNLLDEIAFVTNLTNKTNLEIALSELNAWQNTFNTGYDAYYVDMLEFWPQLYRTSEKIDMVYNEDGTVNISKEGDLILSETRVTNYLEWLSNGCWNPDFCIWDSETKNVEIINPEGLLFWIDFLDYSNINIENYYDDQEVFNTYKSLLEFSVPIIGRRTKAINDDKVKAIYFRETPSLLFINDQWKTAFNQDKLAYDPIVLDDSKIGYFRISTQGKSAKEVLDNLFYEGTYFQEQITLQTIPVYYLEPNVRIAVHDNESDINGEYIIKSYSIQFNAQNMMSITANKAVDRYM